MLQTSPGSAVFSPFDLPPFPIVSVSKPSGGGKRIRKASAGDESGGYSLDWFRFGELLRGSGLSVLTGGEDVTQFCDEPVDEDKVRVGLTLLNSLAGEPTSVAGPWTEDVAAGRARAEEIGEGLADSYMPEFKECAVRVYRASTTGELDRFELTYLSCGDQLQYACSA
jgi:hypothetical protein